MRNEDSVAAQRSNLKSWALATAMTWAFGVGACAAQPAPQRYELSSRATEWLTQSVCADASDHATSADPYYACPAGAHLRKIKWGEAPTYHNANKVGNLWSDSIILSDAKGRPLFVHITDWGPWFGQFANNVDGYDTYTLSGGYAAIDATKQGDNGGQTFFGGNCSRDLAWILFPMKDFTNPGTSHTQIGSSLWEQSGDSFPGPCPTNYDALRTDWRLLKNFPFGAQGAKKPMDAIIVYHDYRANVPNWLKVGHMEVFYYTQQYGLTRWEFWAPAQQGTKPAAGCDVPPTANFNGTQFVISQCEDWSKTTPARPTDDEAWPLPQANLLTDGHITSVHPGSGGVGWGISSPGGGGRPNWQLTNSKAAGDTVWAKTGVKENILDCRGQPGCAALSQDVPASQAPSGVYLYGASVRTSPGTQGNFRVTLQGLGASGNVLWSDSVEQPIQSYNGSHRNDPTNFPKESQSVYPSTAFPRKVIRLPATPGVVTYRIVLTAVGDARYEVTEGWFNRLPDGWTGPINVAKK